MRTFALLIVSALFLPVIAAAADTPGTNPVKRISDQAISNKYPSDYATINRALADNKGKEAADAALALLAKAKADPGRNQGTAGDRKAADSIYQAAWRTCLQVRQLIDGPSEKKSIRDEWVKGLRENEDDAKWPLYALADVWDRDFFTGEFWQFLHRVEKPEALSAVCYLLFARGEHADVAFLREKRKLTRSAQDQAMLDRAIAWLDYKQRSRESEVTPPAFPPPRIE